MVFMGLAVSRNAPWVAGDKVSFRAKWHSFFHENLKDLSFSVVRQRPLKLGSKQEIENFSYIGPDAEGWIDMYVTLVCVRSCL